MSSIFNAENPFFRGLNKVVDVMVISCVWSAMNAPAILVLWFCFESKAFVFYPIIFLTMALTGPSTVAMYYATNKSIRHGRGYMLREFFHSFKDNFKQGFAAAAILCGALSLLGFDIYLMYLNSSSEKLGKLCSILLWVFVVFIAFLMTWASYLFSYIARFSNRLGAILKNSALIALMNLPKSILQFVLLGLTAFACVFSVWNFTSLPYISTVFFFLPGLYTLIKSFILEKTFRKYMSEEDIAEEDERNREYKN